jgi:hypothetical protein
MKLTHSPLMREGKLTPLNSDDEEPMFEDQKRAQESALRRAQKANTRWLPAPARFEGAGEQSQTSTQMITRSQAKGIEGDQRASTEIVPASPVAKKKAKKVQKASGAGSLRSVVGSG